MFSSKEAINIVLTLRQRFKSKFIVSTNVENNVFT